ncbi:MAG: TIR domain-containing protein [Dysgonomonas sp.]|uniref:SEFIR domain-containing protein n=1 Tax=Dysgonomonas sp. TaxID=1891233 RepID=UPI0039E43EA6
MLDKKEVFVTYSWDGNDHSDKVLAFTNFLREKGFYAEMDKMLIQKESTINFKQMMHRAMTDYEKVIVILSKGYKDKAENFRGGVGNEYTLILNDIELNSKKYILVSFEGINNDIIPLFFRNREIINLSSYKEEELSKLYRKLQDIEEYIFSEVALVKPLINPKLIPAIFHNSKNDNLEFIDISQIEGIAEFSGAISSIQDINILKLLNLSFSEFFDASQHISENPQDVENGVVKVYIKTNLYLFKTFHTCVLKVYDNGDKQYLLYTTTKDIQQIINIYETLSSVLGIGVYDNRIRNSFRDISKIKDIADGFSFSESDACHAMWRINDVYTIWLNYHVNPLQQLVLSIDERKVVDRPNISRNDSILNYMHFDIEDIIKDSIEIYKDIENDKIRYIDYFALLPTPLFKIFTNAKIRIFGSEKKFHMETQTHLFFYTKNNIFNIEDIKSITTELVSIYGTDNSGQGNLNKYEIENASTYQSWILGRWYSFDKTHRLLNRKSNESSMYDVRIEYNEITDEGLHLSVIAFNNLVKYMYGEI